MTTLQDQIIDAMARALADSENGAFSEWRCVNCGGEQSTHDHFNCPWIPVLMPTRAALRTAAIFYGMVLHANGATWEKIARAAREATCDTCLGVGAITYGDEEEDTCPHGCKPFDESAFASALIFEGLWEGRGETSGPSWFDEHARFTLVVGLSDRTRVSHDGGASFTPSVLRRPFIVPPLTFNHEEER